MLLKPAIKILLVISLFGLFGILTQAFAAQTTCQTTDFCCAVSLAGVVDTNNCGYAIFNVSGGTTTGYLCDKAVPASCKTARVCDPNTDPELRANNTTCKVVPNGAIFATPTPTFTPTPTASASASSPASGSSLLELKKKIYDVGYPSFGDITKQALFLIPLFVALMWLL